MENNPDPRPLVIKLSLSVIEDLGEKLYSNVPAVLSELVANSWDADANQVSIEVERGDKPLVRVRDDGKGMTRDEVIDHFLTMGYQKREEEGAVTPRGRHVMGRKGIGKLSAFAIANVVKVFTVKGGDRTGFKMVRQDIKNEVRRAREQGKPEEYRPKEYTEKEWDEYWSQYPEPERLEKGTLIVLEELDKRLIRTEEHVGRRLARRFSIVGPANDFAVEVNREPITTEQRDYYKKLEFLWFFGSDARGDGAVASKAEEQIAKEESIAEMSSSLMASPNRLPGRLEIGYDEGELDFTEELEVSGWLGTVAVPGQIDDVNTAVSVFAHGKLVHENILADVREARYIGQYLIGEIEADFLDADDREDIVTSDRQSVKQTDPRYRALRDFVKQAVNRIEPEWKALRKEIGARRALEIAPVRDWYRRLRPEQQPYAKSLFGQIEQLKFGEEKTRYELYKSSLLAFEKLALDDALDKLDELQFESENDFKLLKALFTNFDEFEAAQYYQIARGRLAVIRELDKADRAGSEFTRQRLIQRVMAEYVFDHLWLLDPSWDSIASEPADEAEIEELFREIEKASVYSEKETRIAIRSRRVSGHRLIVDLRKYDAEFEYRDLHQQLYPYVDEVREMLESTAPETNSVRLICVVGWDVTMRPEERHSLSELGIEIKTYDRLLESAKREYGEYLRRRSEVSDLIAIIDEIEAESNSSSPDDASISVASKSLPSTSS